MADQITTEEQAWKKCQEAFRHNKSESKSWQEYHRMNQKSYAEYEVASEQLINRIPDYHIY